MDTAAPPRLASCLPLLGLLLWPGFAGADDDGWGGMVGLNSDYAYRGVSLSDNKPSLALDGHYRSEADGYAGLGLASAQRGSDSATAAAVDAYVGQGWAFGEDWSGSLGYTHYDYIGGEYPALYRYDELGASLGWRRNLLFSVAASPNTSTPTYSTGVWYDSSWAWPYTYVSGNHRGPAYAYELALSQPLPWAGVSASGGIGYRDLRRLEQLGYTYGSAGLRWDHGPWELALSRIASSHAASALCCGSPPVNRWVGSLDWRF